MSATPTKVNCPKCGRSKPYKGPDCLYWCDHCKAQFDDQPDEGGDYSSRDPSARLEREERHQQERQQRFKQKFQQKRAR